MALGTGDSGSLAMWIAIAAVGASSLRFVMLIGELNFAVAAFYGIGAYAAGVGATLFELPFAVSLLLSGLLAGAVSRSEEHTSELQSLMRLSYAVFCLKNNTTSSYTVYL